MQAKQSTAASTARAPAAPGSKRKEPSLATSRPMTRRQRVTADDTAGAKTLFEDKAREEDTEYVPEEREAAEERAPACAGCLPTTRPMPSPLLSSCAHPASARG